MGDITDIPVVIIPYVNVQRYWEILYLSFDLIIPLNLITSHAF